MPEKRNIVSNLNAGEMSPRAFGRNDIQAYVAASKTLLNYLVDPAGGIYRRPGTRFVAETAGPVFLMPFVTATSDSYILEWTDYKLRFYRSEGILAYSSYEFTEHAFNDRAEQLELVGHGYYHGQKVQLTEISGTLPVGLAAATDYYVCLPQAKRLLTMSGAGLITTEANPHEINPEMGPYRMVADYTGSVRSGPFYYIFAAPAANTLQLARDKGGSLLSLLPSSTGSQDSMCLYPQLQAEVDSFRLSDDPNDMEGSHVAFAAATAGSFRIDPSDTAAPVVIDTPYTKAQAEKLQWAESKDTLFLWHDDFPVHELLRFNEAAFVLQQVEFTDGPYDELAPYGVDVRCEITDPGDALVGDWGEMTFGTSFLKGSDVNRWVRKNYEGAENGLLWSIGRIARIGDYVSQDASWQFLPPIRNTWSDADIVFDLIAIPGHAFVDDEKVWLRESYDGLLPVELAERTPYWIVSSVAGISVRLAATKGGAAIVPTAGTAEYHEIISARLVTVTDAGAPLAHALLDGDDWIGLSGDGELPKGLQEQLAYKIELDGSTAFVYLRNRDNSEVPFLSQGSGKWWVNGSTYEKSVAQVRWVHTPPDISSDQADNAKDATEFWRLSHWSAENGFPGAGAIFDERLFCGGTDADPHRVWASRSGDLTNMALDVETGTDTEPGSRERTTTDASGFDYRLSIKRIDKIRWMMPAKVLLIGTDGAVFEFTASSQRETLTPTNRKAEKIDKRGSARLNPIVASTDLIYVNFHQTKVLAASYELEKDAFAPRNLTRIADHVLTKNDRAIQLAYQEEPVGILWMTKQSGKLRACSFDKDEQINAWADVRLGGEHKLGGEVLPWGRVHSADVISHHADEPHGLYGQLWCSVERWIDGATVYYSEFMENRFDLDDDVEDAHFVDCAGPTVDVIIPIGGYNYTQATHLKNAIVDLWVRGSTQQLRAVDAAGAVTTDSVSSALGNSIITIGLPAPGRWEGMPLDSSALANPPTHGSRKKILDLALHFLRTLTVKVGFADSELETCEFGTRTQQVGQPVQPFTGRFDQLDPPIGDDLIETALAMETTGAGPSHLTHVKYRMDFEP